MARAGIDFPVRMHDLRHAHASCLLAGGADLKSVMERMGHAQVMTTQRYPHTVECARGTTGRPSDGRPSGAGSGPPRRIHR
nr:tyrosine-type recombinase/integrase [Cellulomonas sp. KRMCY2]